ncbi:MAG: transcriptional regulator PpsR [Marivibrio sp.]|uniref:transcriptional regulator PpsR n=1 Tax=Marivibrio sp. TaxID=2039719 RepID=UPI0032EB5030
MQSLAPTDEKARFKDPERFLGALDVVGAGRLIAAASDVALVLDADGAILDAAFGSSELASHLSDEWIGRSLSDVVTGESRAKIDALLADSAGGQTRWRQVNHPVDDGVDVPVKYMAVPLGDGRVLAVGREMRALAALQQRLVDTQLSLEREYARLRTAETRYRLLFQIAAEAVLIVDAANHKIVEANPAAAKLLNSQAKRLIGANLFKNFEGPSAQALDQLLARVRETGRPGDASVTIRGAERALSLSASLFRQDSLSMYLIRITPESAGEDMAGDAEMRAVAHVVSHAPDAFVVTDFAGRVLSANGAFLDMAQAPSEELVRGETLERWLGRSGVDMNVLMANLKEHGSIRLFATTLRSEYGTDIEVEMSAAAARESDPPCLGFLIRAVEGRVPADAPGETLLPKSAEQLTNLVGRVPLKDLVQETTDIIERLCIEAALRLTGDNRASAAEMLGLSRQSLYVKLRRHGIGNLE